MLDKPILGSPVLNFISSDGGQIDGIPQLSVEENSTPRATFTEKEVKEVVVKMEHNKAPGGIFSWVLSEMLESNQN